jgi:hypothetical protein
LFRFLLRVEDGEPNDPAVFVTVVPNWTIEEELLLGDGERLRILAIDTEIADELVERGINAGWTTRGCWMRATVPRRMVRTLA